MPPAYIVIIRLAWEKKLLKVVSQLALKVEEAKKKHGVLLLRII